MLVVKSFKNLVKVYFKLKVFLWSWNNVFKPFKPFLEDILYCYFCYVIYDFTIIVIGENSMTKEEFQKMKQELEA